MKKILVSFVISLGIFFSFFFLHHLATADETPTPTLTPTPAQSQSSSEEARKKKEDEIKQLETQLASLQNQTKTLSSQIAVMNSQIKLTELRVAATKQEIVDINDDIEITRKKISSLDSALNHLTKVLINRIIATYQIGTVDPLYVLLSSNSVSDLFSRANYLKIVKNHDKKLIFETQQAKNDYTNQKELFEEKKKKVETLKSQLESYTAQLDLEKKSKQTLLDLTRNDEKRYQDLLAKARAEYEAIQGIVAGRGQETQYGAISEGQKIASVISGSSCNSGGAHLHFIVSRNGATENPFSYLKSGVDYKNCSGEGVCSEGDPFNPSGNWNWPIDPTIKLTQGYGATWATRNDPIIRQIYNFHNGIDIVGSSDDVKTVRAGTLYQGSYSGGGGCRLRYVRVHHNEGDFDTFYLHINYTF